MSSLQKDNKEIHVTTVVFRSHVFFCKTMEHIIACGLTKHFDRHNILYELQHDFRERRSCGTQLIQLVEDLARNLMSGTQTDLILLDFIQAFDKVSHLKLLYKLKMPDVQGTTLE